MPSRGPVLSECKVSLLGKGYSYNGVKVIHIKSGVEAYTDFYKSKYRNRAQCVKFIRENPVYLEWLKNNKPPNIGV